LSAVPIRFWFGGENVPVDSWWLSVLNKL